MLPYSDGIQESNQLPNGLCIPIRQARSRFLSFYEYSTPNYFQSFHKIPQISAFAPAPVYNYDMGSMLPSCSNNNENPIMYSQNTPAISKSLECLNSSKNNENNQKQFNQKQYPALTSRTIQINDEENQLIGNKVIQRKLFASKVAKEIKLRKKEQKDKDKQSQIKLCKKLKINLHLPLEEYNLDSDMSYESKKNKTCEKEKAKPVIGLISCCDEFFTDVDSEIQKPYQTKIMKRKEIKFPQTERVQDIEIRKLKHINLEINGERKITIKKEPEQTTFPVIDESISSESKIEDSSHSNSSIDQSNAFNFAKAVSKVESKFTNFSRKKSDFKNQFLIQNPKKLSDSRLDIAMRANYPLQDMMNLGEI